MLAHSSKSFWMFLQKTAGGSIHRNWVATMAETVLLAPRGAVDFRFKIQKDGTPFHSSPTTRISSRKQVLDQRPGSDLHLLPFDHLPDSILFSRDRNECEVSLQFVACTVPVTI
jgi:hypothetical protein